MILRSSAAGRYVSCPGAFHASKDLPDVESAAATEGTQAHEAVLSIVRGQPACSVSEYADKLVARYASEVIALIGGQEWKAEESLQHGYWSGHPDYIVMGEPTKIIELKFGRLPVASAECNAQARAYAYLLFASGMVAGDSVHVHILQPSGTTSAIITRQDADEMVTVAKRAMRANARRRPSEDACRYCRACGNIERCPETVRQALAVGRGLPTKPEQWLAYYAKLKAVEKLVAKGLDQADAYLRGLSVEAQRAIGMSIAPGRNRVSIKSTADAWPVLAALGVTSDQALSAAKLSIPQLCKAAKLDRDTVTSALRERNMLDETPIPGAIEIAKVSDNG